LNAVVAEETIEMARSVSDDRLRTLPVERVTNEFRKAVRQADDAGQFFRVLDAVDALEQTFPVLAEQNTHDLARTVSTARNAADTAEDRFGSVLAALGDLLGDDAERVADAADLTRQEQATLHVGRDVLADVARFDQLPDSEVVAVFGRLNSDRGADPSAFVAAADARHDNVDRKAVEQRLRRAAHVFNAVDGAAVIHDEGVTPGVDMSGEEFGELLADRRAEAL
jgi:tRNA nucleotidyltransferase/poly(A) polymerase